MKIFESLSLMRWSNRAVIAGLCATGALPAAMALVPRKASPVAPPVRKIEFAKDVQPILKAHCYQCHSSSQAQGALVLDNRAAMVKRGKSGFAVVPGDSSKSLLLYRLSAHPNEARMPLGFAPLSAKDTATLKDWIDQGAVWSEAAPKPLHWAYKKPVRSKIPKTKNLVWARNPIDSFILARLEKEGLQPSPEADKTTLIRRVTLDLTGLPPTPKEVDAFLADKSPNAYEKVVYRLFASSSYGERMALPWLDAARYADSNGFQQDGDTYQYVWRDWVVKAMNANMPFNQFTVEQIAGDLLPNATTDQKVATGFNRCHLLNGEGGAIAEEQRNVILFDRVDVTSTTWLGATMACAQCHDHKYDPITQKDYYSFMAFFNNVPETGTPPFGGQYRIADPWIYAGGDVDQVKLKAVDAEIESVRKSTAEYSAKYPEELKAAQVSWEREASKTASAPKLSIWNYIGPFPGKSYDEAFDTDYGPEKSVDLTKAYGARKWVSRPELADGAVQQLDGENSAVYLYRIVHTDQPTKLTLSLGSDDAIKLWVNGKLIVVR